MLRRTLRVLSAALASGLAGAVLLAAPAPASAETTSDPEDVITAYDLDVRLDRNGTADVTLDLTVDFGRQENHGPFLTYVVKQRFDDTQDRVYRIRDVRASSPTAKAGVEVEEEGAVLAIRIGSEDHTFAGAHEYTVTFRVEGWVNSAGYFGPTTGLSRDELNLNVLSSWQIPVRDVRVTVTGPESVTSAECAAGYSSADPCTSASAEGAVATFTQKAVPPGSQLTVVAAFPAGTFGDAAPILQERWAFGRAFALTPVIGGVVGLLALVGVGLVARRARQRGRDAQYLGLTPGLAPVGGQEVAVGARRRGPVAVRFTPPDGFRPGQIGTLVDERADPHDVTATLIDLAVRGYLRIEPITQEPGLETKPDWRLIQLDPGPSELLQVETVLLSSVFAARDSVTLSELRTTFASSMSQVQSLLYEDVTARGWFRGNPRTARLTWVAGGIGLVLAGILITVLLAIWTSWGLAGLPAVLTGVVAIALSSMAPARTAAGTAVLAQAQGFRQYLATAEAAQIRFEEGEDLFSRYLPYAVAFGLTERWAKVFADLAAQGRAVPDPTWYGVAYGQPAFWAMGGASFASDLSAFTATTDAALTAPTPGSSGSSGGGGYSGGGVSGGGGGTW